jgi:hypothetical protein
MFLSDSAEFAAPLPPMASKWGKKIADIGENNIGKIFLKKAQNVARYDGAGNLLKHTYGIANSGRTIRKTPLALAGLGAAGYGAYRTKKVYDRYKPEITMGRKLMRNYNALKNKFNWNGERS